MTGVWAPFKRSRDETGDTLIEVLVALVIIGIAFAVIVGGIGTAIIGASLQQNTTMADSLVRSAAETVTSHVAYKPCAVPADYQPALATPPLGFSVSVTSVAYWDQTSNAFDNPTTCVDSGLQLVTVTATAVGTDVHIPEPVTLQVVKRQ